MRIVLADDHALFRDGVSSLLRAWGHDVVGHAADGRDAIDLVMRLEPDLVLMDVRMPGMSGVQATRAIAASRPETPIVMLTVSEDEEDLFAAIRAGARGGPRRSASSAGDRPACLRPTTSPGWAIRSPSSRRCRCPAA
jgi:DNA-binding NarL/FixJ family response regulator